MRTAYVQIPAYSESPWRDRLESIVSQSPPDGWHAEFEAWVTPSCSDLSSCQTYQEAVAVDGVEAFEAPPGKLSARNAAHDHAAERGADVIVTWDADAPPLADHTLATLLMPFDDDRVVATNGNPVAPKDTIIGRLVNYGARVEDRVNPHIHGQLSAFTVEGWRAAGPFDTDLDQREIVEVRQEEEFGFRERLAAHGRVVDVPQAVVHNDTRRFRCMGSPGHAFAQFTPKYPHDEFCSRRGVETFQPDD